VLRRTVSVGYLKPMSGKSQPHLMWCADSTHYIVKFRENPLGGRLIANEVLGGLLARKLGLTVPRIALVDVGQDLIRATWNLAIKSPHAWTKPKAGLAFGSQHVNVRLVAGRRYSGTFDMLPDSIGLVKNLPEFAGMLVFDKWTCNTNPRQIVYASRGRLGGWGAVMIDNGHCFGGIDWELDDLVTRGIFARHDVYRDIRGDNDFEPWLYQLESKFDRSILSQAASEIPDDWYDGDKAALDRLVNTLDHRRQLVRGLLHLTRQAKPEIFPKWHLPTSVKEAFKAAGF
jgi:hypothetical protein